MDPMATYGTIFERQTILDGARRGTQNGSGDIVGGTRLRPGFFTELLEADPIKDAAGSTVPILVVTGRRDPLVADGATLAERMAAARAAETVVVDLDAGHGPRRASRASTARPGDRVHRRISAPRKKAVTEPALTCRSTRRPLRDRSRRMGVVCARRSIPVGAVGSSADEAAKHRAAASREAAPSDLNGSVVYLVRPVLEFLIVRRRCSMQTDRSTQWEVVQRWIGYRR